MKSLFIREIEAGMRGENPYIRSPFPVWDAKAGTIQKKKIYLIGAPTKTGKTTWVDYFYILNPYLNREELRNRGIKLHYKYYSYEIDLLEKLANYTSFFLNHLYGIRADIAFIQGLKEEKPSGNLLDKIKRIEEEHLIPLFGQYDDYGQRVSEGIIDFIEYKMNPTGIYKQLLDFASKRGTFVKRKYHEDKEKLVGYTPNDPGLFVIGIFDHVGLIPRERSYSKKENLDTFSQYLVRLRNLCKFTFIPVSQFNRGLGKTDRLKFSGELLQPTLDDFKDTGNLAEDANTIIGLFNPSNYPHLETHLGYDLNRLREWYRSVHVLANRSGAAPLNFGMFMDLIGKSFGKLPHPDANIEEAYQRVREIVQMKVF